MEMPYICECCKVLFDLNDGVGSTKWYKNIVICEQCGELEDQEIQLDDEIEECKNMISDAEWTIKEQTKELEEILEKKKKLDDRIIDRVIGNQ